MDNLMLAMSLQATRAATPKFACRECGKFVTLADEEECPHCGEYPFAGCSDCGETVHPDGVHEVIEHDDEGEERTFVECDGCFEKNEPQRLAIATHEEFLCQEDSHDDR